MIFRNILAVIAGLVVGMAWNMGLVLLNVYKFFPMPEGTSMEQPEKFKAYIADLPPTAFLVILVAHVGQALFGGWVAARLAGSLPLIMALIVGVFTAFGSAYNQVDLKGPAWMWVDPVLCIACAWFVGQRERARRDAA